MSAGAAQPGPPLWHFTNDLGRKLIDFAQRKGKKTVNQLIEFPEAGDAWTDTGEGGMYVMAVVPRLDDGDKCVIENFIVLTRPEAAVSSLADFWLDPEGAAEEERAQSHAARLLEREGYAAQAAMVRSLESQSSFSVPVMGAIDLGSTGLTLTATDGSGFWEAGLDDLTPTGVLAVNCLRSRAGVEPRLLTFLDT